MFEEKFCMKIEYCDYYYDKQIIRKCGFYSYLFCNFLCADDYLEVIVALKSVALCQEYLEIEASNSQLVEKAMKCLF